MTDTPIYIDDNILYPPFTIDKCEVFVNRANENGKNVIQYGENRYAIAYNEIMGKKDVEIDVPDYDPETGEQTGTHKETIIIDYPVLNPNYEQEQAIKERQRLDNLTLTPSDVERALYYGLGMDFDDLKNLISTQAPQIDIKGLAIEFRANNFYRGAVDKNGNRIIDMVGLLLGYDAIDMDYLFEHKELPTKGTKDEG